MINIEKSIDTIGYQIWDRFLSERIIARVYALEDTKRRGRFILYRLNIDWPFRGDKPTEVIGRAKSIPEADEKLRAYVGKNVVFSQ